MGTNTPNLDLYKPEDGEGHPPAPGALDHDWAGDVNSNWDILDAAFYSRQANCISVLDPAYGVVTGTGVGTAVAQANSVGINAASAAAGSTGQVFCPPGVIIECYDPLVFRGSIAMEGATLDYVGPVNVGGAFCTLQEHASGATPLAYLYKTAQFPNLIGHAWTTPATWVGTMIALHIKNVAHCPLLSWGHTVAWAEAIRIESTGPSLSCSRNYFRVGSLSSANKVGLHLLVAPGANGYISSNEFVGGGGMSFSPSITNNTPGSKSIWIDCDLGGQVCDANLFWGLCIEGRPEYLLDLKRTTNNIFVGRFETLGSKIRFEATTGSDIRFQSPSYFSNVEVVYVGTENGNNRFPDTHRLASLKVDHSRITRGPHARWGPTGTTAPHGSSTVSIETGENNPAGIYFSDGLYNGTGPDPFTESLSRLGTGVSKLAGRLVSGSLISAANLKHMVHENLLIQSEQFHLPGSTGWFQANITVTQNVGPGPSGASTADRVTLTSTVPSLYQTPPITGACGGRTFSGGVWVRSFDDGAGHNSVGKTLKLALDDNGPPLSEHVLDLTTFILTTSWQRIGVTSSFSAANASTTLRLRLTNGNLAIGDAFEIAEGSMAEADRDDQIFYIPTLTTRVTPATYSLLTPYPLSVQGTAARHYSGTGSPEGVYVAAVGSTYGRTDGGAGTSFYVKESGAGNTGWVAK